METRLEGHENLKQQKLWRNIKRVNKHIKMPGTIRRVGHRNYLPQFKLFTKNSFACSSEHETRNTMEQQSAFGCLFLWNRRAQTALTIAQTTHTLTCTSWIYHTYCVVTNSERSFHIVQKVSFVRFTSRTMNTCDGSPMVIDSAIRIFSCIYSLSQSIQAWSSEHILRTGLQVLFAPRWICLVMKLAHLYHAID